MRGNVRKEAFIRAMVQAAVKGYAAGYCLSDTDEEGTRQFVDEFDLVMEYFPIRLGSKNCPIQLVLEKLATEIAAKTYRSPHTFATLVEYAEREVNANISKLRSEEIN